jgi:DNA-binding SARP family transcriptional activator
MALILRAYWGALLENLLEHSWRNLGAMLRIYLTGNIQLERPGCFIDERAFPGRQGRRAFASLALNRGTAVPREVLAGAVWGDALPPAWNNALSAIVSKLRGALAPVDVDIATVHGAHRLALPSAAWLDSDAATFAIDEAEGAFRRGDVAAAFGPAAVAATIAARPFLPGEDADWIDGFRERLRGLRVRALDILAEVWLANGEHALAVNGAAEVVALEPFRDSAYLRLMRAHVAAGNRAEALRVYENCRRLLADELGADPAPETQALYLQLLGS